jgi:hypothetical protein
VRIPLARPIVTLAVIATGYSTAAAAQTPAGRSVDASVSLRFGTPGLGLEVAKLLTDHVSVRAGANFLKFSSSSDRSDITYDAEARFHSFSALVDLYPGRRGSFHLSGGIFTNPLTIKGTGRPSPQGTFEINHHQYPTGAVGDLTLEGKFKSVGPYLGLGWGTPANKHSALKFLLDLGVVIGKPSIVLGATGASINPQLAADLEAQRQTTEKDIDKYAKVYPVIAFGLGFRF